MTILTQVDEWFAWYNQSVLNLEFQLAADNYEPTEAVKAAFMMYVARLQAYNAFRDWWAEQHFVFADLDGRILVDLGEWNATP
jgi:hypothetical protein